MDCQFSFGPNNSFFCKSSTHWSWSDNNTLPEPLRLILEDPNHPQFNKFPYDVALAMEPGVFSMCWKTKNDQDYYEADYLGPHYAKLGTFMANMTANTVFGPYHSYFSTSKSGLSWQNLPPALETIIMDRIKLGRPSTVALGLRGAFVVLFDDSTIGHNLQGLYPEVQALIDSAEERKKRNSITCVALSPYVAGHYFVAFGNGSAQWNLPAEMEADVRNVCASLRPLPARSSGQPDTLLGATLNYNLTRRTGLALNSLFLP
ncbi:hypothetical protein FB451DRAFT_1256267 [Mycena latifolia]|nr:hypothetical protein FB451DRAFT_1256267 [Mycena latifolia]